MCPIVLAGLSRAVLAERYASDGKRVLDPLLVLEKRDSIGGYCYYFID